MAVLSETGSLAYHTRQTHIQQAKHRHVGSMCTFDFLPLSISALHCTERNKMNYFDSGSAWHCQEQKESLRTPVQSGVLVSTRANPAEASVSTHHVWSFHSQYSVGIHLCHLSMHDVSNAFSNVYLIGSCTGSTGAANTSKHT